MSYQPVIDALEAEWSPDDGREGFFWRVRQGDFDAALFHRALGRLSSMSFANDAHLPRRLVSLL